MGNDYRVRCALCGQESGVLESAIDLLEAAKTSSTYVCDACAHKVKYESEQRLK